MRNSQLHPERNKEVQRYQRKEYADPNNSMTNNRDIDNREKEMVKKMDM